MHQVRKKRVLLVDDSEETHFVVRRSLEPKFDISWTKTIRDASRELLNNRYDLILLDGGMPDGDGFELCAQLKQTEDVPIVLLTGRTELPEKTLGFAAGADDYICKPFDPVELRIRVQARLRQAEYHSAVNRYISCGDLRIDLNRQKAFQLSGKSVVEIVLTAIEFRLLSYLAARPEHVFTRSQLMDAVWGSGSELNDRTVDKRISMLRMKLGTLGSYLGTVAGGGYRFSSEDSRG